MNYNTQVKEETKSKYLEQWQTWESLGDAHREAHSHSQELSSLCSDVCLPSCPRLWRGTGLKERKRVTPDTRHELNQRSPRTLQEGPIGPRRRWWWLPICSFYCQWSPMHTFWNSNRKCLLWRRGNQVPGTHTWCIFITSWSLTMGQMLHSLVISY